LTTGDQEPGDRWHLPALPTTLADLKCVLSTTLARLLIDRLETELARLLLHSHPICNACATLRQDARRRLVLRTQARRKEKGHPLSIILRNNPPPSVGAKKDDVRLGRPSGVRASETLSDGDGAEAEQYCPAEHILYAQCKLREASRRPS
jgi:hypothetical protein